jgi:hypothetical protein
MQGATLRTVAACGLIVALGLRPTSTHAQTNYLVDLGVATGYGINNSGWYASE